MSSSQLAWVVLTMGDRWPETTAAVESLRRTCPDDEVVMVLNGTPVDDVPDFGDDVRMISLPENIGVPGGRACGVDALDDSIGYVGFLDDDAVVLSDNVDALVRQRFESDPSIGVVSMRLVDPDGDTAQRHSPRIGLRGVATAGLVPTFLGGASVVRRSAYEEVGGYWSELFYSHEELELAWRLADAGWSVFYDPALHVEHPKTEIARHARGWELTGRNRVLIARRNLPLPVVAIHTLVWLVAGVIRAPTTSCRRAYIGGWRSGWAQSVDRAPMSWTTVARLTALGRPPVI